MLMPEQHDRGLGGGSETWQGNGVLGEFHSEQAPSLVPATPKPGIPVATNPVDAGPSASECVSLRKGRSVMLGVRHRHASSDSVAGSEQSPEIDLVGDPQGGHDESSMAVAAAAARLAQVSRAQLARAQQARAVPPQKEKFMIGRLSGGVRPSTRGLQ